MKETKNRKNHKVIKLSDLANKLGIRRAGGISNEKYLEYIIEEIQKNGLVFVQFFQLMDLVYVILLPGDEIQSVNDKLSEKDVQFVNLPADPFRPDEEIRNHYNPPASSAKTPDPQPVFAAEENPIENIKKRDHLDKNLKASPFPWKKK
jgi:hypothetical protein